MIWLRKRKREKMGIEKSGPLRCPAHKRFVKRHECCLKGLVDLKTGNPHVCWGPIDPHHVTTVGAGGGDDECVPVCRGGHDLVDRPGWSQRLVEERFGINFKDLAEQMAGRSKALKLYHKKREAEGHGER